jgi:hypothetical protein
MIRYIFFRGRKANKIVFFMTIKDALALRIWILSSDLKGQSHKKVGELRVCGISLGPN